MNLDTTKHILIVGMGLLGGSYAKALTKKGFYVSAITRSKNNTDKRIHSVNDFFLRKDCNEKYYFLYS